MPFGIPNEDFHGGFGLPKNEVVSKKYRLYYMNVNNGNEFFIEVNNSEEILAELQKVHQYVGEPDNWECFDEEEIKG